MRVGRERQRQFVSGPARAAVETAVDVPDHGDALSPDREETIMTIQFEIYLINSFLPPPPLFFFFFFLYLLLQG